jgi:hypothetical protein
MRRLCVLTLALLFGLGCVTEGDRAQWGEALKDLRGDNMKMQSEKGKRSEGPAGRP